MWNFDISQAPKGGFVEVDSGRRDKGGNPICYEEHRSPPVILATKCGKVTTSRWLEKGRWNMLADGEQPVAWMAWPEHPGAED